MVKGILNAIQNNDVTQRSRGDLRHRRRQCSSETQTSIGEPDPRDEGRPEGKAVHHQYLQTGDLMVPRERKVILNLT